MACSVSIQSLLVVPSPPMSSLPPLSAGLNLRSKFPCGKRKPSRKCGALVVRGPSSAYAREMERLSAKDALLLALEDSGGFEALVTGKTTDIQRIDVNERIVSLERLNPTPRPTTSPYLEGQWNFKWFGSGNYGLLIAQFLFERFPSVLATLSKLDVRINDGYSEVSANLRFLDMIESSFSVSNRLSVQGPLRMREEYIEVIFEFPKVAEVSMPEQLGGAFGHAAYTVQQLPVPIRDAVAGGFKVPLGEHFIVTLRVSAIATSRASYPNRFTYRLMRVKCGVFQKLFLISYLDDEILIIRDAAGVPEVAMRLGPPPSPLVQVQQLDEYEN